MSVRTQYKSRSNNNINPNQNICAQRVARFFNVDSKVRYLHTYSDLQRAIRKQFSVRSVRSYVKGATVGAVRRSLSNVGAQYYIVWVKGHVLLLDSTGKTIVDTAPRKRDARKIIKIHGIYY